VNFIKNVVMPTDFVYCKYTLLIHNRM